MPKSIARADSVWGQTLIAGKSFLDTALMLLRAPSRQSIRLARLIFRVKPRYTMVTNKHLTNLYELVRVANRLNVPGDLVECGVWNGGSAAVMAEACRQDPRWYQRRTLWLFDSFQGLPPPGEHDSEFATSFFSDGWCKGSIDQVNKIFAKLGISLQNVRIVPGWFEATIPAAEVAKIAVLHIDADWYRSVKLVLDRFFDKVVSGGFVVLDDYGYWPGCRKAVHDYLDEHGVAGIRVIEIDQDGAYIQIP